MLLCFCPVTVYTEDALLVMFTLENLSRTVVQVLWEAVIPPVCVFRRWSPLRRQKGSVFLVSLEGLVGEGKEETEDVDQLVLLHWNVVV